MAEYIFKPSRRVKGKRVLSRFWHGRFSVGRGPVRSVSLGMTDKTAARAKLRQIVVDAEREAAGIVAPRTVRDAAAASLVTLLAEYRADMRGRELTANHIKESTGRIERIINGVGWRRLCDVTPETFTAWRGGLTCSAKTKHEYQTSVKAFLNWLVRGSRLLVNPLAKVDAVKRQGKQVRLSRAFTAGEFTALLGVAPLYRRIVYQFLAYTGLRKKEARTLRRDALDLERGILRVVGKGGKARVVPVRVELVEALRAWLALPLRDALLFPRFPSDDALHADFKRAGIQRKNEAGRVVHWHAFRKTFTTWAASAGVGLRSAQAVLGHSTPNLTANTYTDVDALPLRQEVQKMPWIAEIGQDLRSVNAAKSFALNPSLSSACNAAISRFRELLAEVVAVGNVALSESFAKVGASGNWLPDMDRAHLPDWMEIYKDPAVREQMYAAPVESETALWHYLQHRKFYSVFAGNDMVGGFSFYDVDGGLASFGIVLRSSFRGVKLGGELVRLMHETARQNGIRTLRADIYADNRSCLRLLENTGYRRFVWYEKNL